MTGAERGEKWKVNNGGGRQHIDGRWSWSTSTRTVPPYCSSFTYEYSTITRRGTAQLHRSMLTQVGDVAVIQDHLDVLGVKLRLGEVRKVDETFAFGYGSTLPKSAPFKKLTPCPLGRSV